MLGDGSGEGKQAIATVKALTPIEHEGQRVVTLAMVDELHQRANGTAGRNFRQHRDKLIEGQDYYQLDPTNFVESSFEHGGSRKLVTALTETGYLMLVKSFQDALAWDVQRALVNGYFRKVPPNQDSPAMLAILDKLTDSHNILIANQQGLQSDISVLRVETNERFDQLESELARVQNRKAPSKNTQGIFGAVIRHRYNGLCPSCKHTHIMAPDTGEWLNNRSWEHFYARHKNKRNEMWVTCLPCNLALEDTAERDKAKSAFDDFQHWCDVEAQPLLAKDRVEQ